MELKDYLHYYIGCKAITTDDNEQAELVGVSDDNAHIVHDGTGSYGTCDITGVKPLLRRLEDMTEAEAIAVHREATKTPFLPADKDEYDVSYIKDKGEVCSIQVVDLRMPKMYTNINIEGDVLVYVHETNEEPKICERVANQHHITHYLLRHGFDLFGLIPAGLAINAKTVEQ